MSIQTAGRCTACLSLPAARNALDSTLWNLWKCSVRSAVPQLTLIVDANESWHGEGLAARCQLLVDLGVAMLEH